MLLTDPKRPDRGFFLAVGIVIAVGILLFAFGVLVAATTPSNAPYGEQRAAGNLELGIFIGPIAVVIALGALVNRWIRGPQAPGRHSRDSDDDTLDLSNRPLLKSDE